MIEIILAILGLILSFIFAGAEIALLSSNRLQLEVWQRREVRGAKSAMSASQNPEQFLTTTLIGNNIANILTTSFATVMLIKVIPNEWVILLIISINVLIFGEIIPKVLFREFPNASMLFFGRFVKTNTGRMHFVLAVDVGTVGKCDYYDRFYPIFNISFIFTRFH